MGLFSSILGAVAGPIAGLFKKDKPQVTENRVDYKRMVKDAEAAGFNPLTVLRNGGSAGFSTQVHHPALSSGGIGDVLATGINAFASYDPMAESRAELEYQLVQEQLKSVQRSNRNEMRSFNVPQHTGTSARYSSGGFSGSVPLARSNGSGGTLAVTDPWTGSIFDPFLKVHPGLPDADTGSTRYGEIIEMLGGIGILGGDLAYSGYKAANKTGNVDKAVNEFNAATRDIREYKRDMRKSAANAFAKASVPSRAKPYYPDMQDYLRGQGPAW